MNCENGRVVVVNVVGGVAADVDGGVQTLMELGQGRTI